MGLEKSKIKNVFEGNQESSVKIVRLKIITVLSFCLPGTSRLVSFIVMNF